MTMTLPFAADFDRRSCRLAEAARRDIAEDGRRIIVAGASGWIGRTVLSLLHEALGPAAFGRRVACFGSREKVVRLISGVPVRQAPLSSLPTIGARPSIYFHLAFLTKDRIEGMDASDYVAENRRISQDALAAMTAIGVDRAFIASSGAVRFFDDPSAAFELRLYGGLKREEEQMFAAWAQARRDRRRVAIARIFSVSGPFINKFETYALASFINDALAGRPITVKARSPVYRSYVAVRDIVNLAIRALLPDEAGHGPVIQFETGGQAVEIGDLAARIASFLGARVERPKMLDVAPNYYCGDDAAWRSILRRHALTGTNLDDQIIETAAYLARESEEA